MTDRGESLVTLVVTRVEAQMMWRALDAYKDVMGKLHVETKTQGAGEFDLNRMTGVLVDLIIKVEDAQRSTANVEEAHRHTALQALADELRAALDAADEAHSIHDWPDNGCSAGCLSCVEKWLRTRLARS